MKVLQINSHFSVGGPPRIMNGIYDTLKEQGIECKIAAAREKMYAPEDSIQIGSKTDVYINALKARVFDNEGFNARRATVKLIKDIKAYNPDIVHLHNLHGYYLNLEILFSYLKESRKPVVWTLHDCWSFTGHCAYFEDVNCYKWKSKCYECCQLRTYPVASVFSNVLNNYKLKKKIFNGIDRLNIVTPSNWLANYVKQSYLRDSNIMTIYNGIDLSRFCPRESGFIKTYDIGRKKIILGVAQVWNKRKGLDDFISLSKLLGPDYKIVLVGLSNEQLDNLPKNIVGINRTNSIDELVDIYSNAYVLVNTTYEDNFPTVNLEALSCGTPVITYRTGGSPEAVDDTCGWVVEQGDLKGVANIINSMGNKDKYSDNCIKRSKLFDRKERYNDYIKLYKSILER